MSVLVVCDYYLKWVKEKERKISSVFIGNYRKDELFSNLYLMLRGQSVGQSVSYSHFFLGAASAMRKC